MKLTWSTCGSVCDMAFEGTLTFADTQVFSDVIALIAEPECAAYTLNLDKLEFIDSSGLSMLILARDEAHTHAKTLVLTSMRGQVSKMFEMARFTEYFTVRKE